MAARTVKSSELEIGMKVELFDGPYGWGTIVAKGPDFLTVHRPHVVLYPDQVGSTGPMVIAGGGPGCTRAMASISTEIFNLSPRDSRSYRVES